jgi:polyisoprenoid-binding protein YceI
LKILLTIFLLVLNASSAQALEYTQVQNHLSTVNFAYTQMGVAMEGKFNTFTAQIAFDPARIANSRARISVALSSIDTGSVEANEEVAGKLWFDSKTYPQALFIASGIKPLGNNRYLARGKLSIKGKTLDINAPVTFQSEGKKGYFDGSFIIKRLAFNIGTGVWADLGTVADDIQIKFHIVVLASPVTAATSSTYKEKP